MRNHSSSEVSYDSPVLSGHNLRKAIEHSHQLGNSLETLWMANSIVLVFLMQIGFALLESGSVRTMNRKSVLLKNFSDVALTAAAWMTLGVYILRGEHGYGSPEENSMRAAKRLLELLFACSCSTIISGAVTERISIFAYAILIVVVSGIIYPVVVLWAWTDNGFLKQLGYVDFAGSSIVHAVGGIVGLISAWRLGPRRFGVPQEWARPVSDDTIAVSTTVSSTVASIPLESSSQSPPRSSRHHHRSERESSRTSRKYIHHQAVMLLEKRVKFIERSHWGTTTAKGLERFSRFERPDLDLKEFQGNSPPFVVIGTLMLWSGFYGFNAGSARITGQSSSVVIRVMWNTTLAAVGGQTMALCQCIRGRLRPRPKLWMVNNPNIVNVMCNATLAGLASICASSDRESGLNSFIIGMLGAALQACISFWGTWCGIDDPLDAGAVHLGGGIVGTLLCGRLPPPDIDRLKHVPRPDFPIQLLGLVVIVSWGALASLLVTETLKRVNLLRVSTELEDVGFDVWLQQSHLPPSAPDVLMPLPEFQNRGSAHTQGRSHPSTSPEQNTDFREQQRQFEALHQQFTDFRDQHRRFAADSPVDPRVDCFEQSSDDEDTMPRPDILGKNEGHFLNQMGMSTSTEGFLEEMMAHSSFQQEFEEELMAACVENGNDRLPDDID